VHLAASQQRLKNEQIKCAGGNLVAPRTLCHRQTMAIMTSCYEPVKRASSRRTKVP
jgi:hypothetical protein